MIAVQDVVSVVQKCENENGIWVNFTPMERRLSSCQFCNLTEDELNVLFSTPRCFPVDFQNYLTYIYILYGIIFMLSLPGNILVIYTISKFRQFHRVAYLFVAHLAFCDLLIMIFCVPFSVASIAVLQHWPFGISLCIGVSYVQAASVFGSAYTLVAISIDRYLAIIYPLKHRWTMGRAKCIITAIWFLSFLTTFPQAFFTRLMTPEMRVYQFRKLAVCREIWPDRILVEIYTFALAVLQYFLPITVLIYTYYRIMVAVWGNKGAVKILEINGDSVRNPTALLRTASGNRSSNKMVWTIMVVFCVYTICWLPFNILQIVREIYPALDEWHSSHIVWVSCHWLAMSHTMYNPLILGLMDTKMRKCFFAIYAKPFNRPSTKIPIQEPLKFESKGL